MVPLVPQTSFLAKGQKSFLFAGSQLQNMLPSQAGLQEQGLDGSTPSSNFFLCKRTKIPAFFAASQAGWAAALPQGPAERLQEAQIKQQQEQEQEQTAACALRGGKRSPNASAEITKNQNDNKQRQRARTKKYPTRSPRST